MEHATGPGFALCRCLTRKPRSNVALTQKTQEGPVSWLGFVLRGGAIGMNDLAIEQT